jgi:hypothetical protein
MEMDNKMAAVVAAVMEYIQTEEAIVMARSRTMPAGASAGPPAPVKLWGVSGRQTIMQMRNMMQLKAFHGVRFR